jgi:glycosyltransferase involved in cell wall biosynthesis
MNIGILGTRGIPNNYGGFEQFAEFLSVGLVSRGNAVSVYNSHKHQFQETSFKGVEIIHCYDPEYRVGTVGQFIYDFNCIRDARKRSFDILLQLGYTSSSVWAKWLPADATIVTNMDGLEWKRTKYKKPVQRFLLKAEKWAVNSSDYLIADSIGIKQYLDHKYNVDSHYIPYGAPLFNDPDEDVVGKYKVKPFEYNMLIARLEPENSIEIILDGVVKSKSEIPLLVVGNNDTSYGKYLKAKYAQVQHIIFVGGIYNQHDLNQLRYFSRLYFHGHQVGGTNPSLLEAMGSQALIAAHDNDFNRAILQGDGLYFSTADDVKRLIDNMVKNDNLSKISNNMKKIEMEFNWNNIIDQYESFFNKILNQ